MLREEDAANVHTEKAGNNGKGKSRRLLRPDTPNTVDIFVNRPSDRKGYETFRGVVSHLSWIQDQHLLRVELLVLRYEWSIPSGGLDPEAFRSCFPTSR